MRIVAKKAQVLFYTAQAESKTALEDWYEKATNADWDDYSQLKKTFNSADSVGNKRVVFNIKGNQYILVAIVLYKIKMVYIRFIGTHDEYNHITDIENI